MNDLTEDDIWFIERLINNHEGSGKIVEHEKFRRGRTFNNKEWINGKIPVYFTDQENLFFVILLI